MTEQVIVITLTREELPVLNDVFFEALNSEDADGDELTSYRALCDGVQRQLKEQSA
jgi:hypothetical protein